VLAADVLDAGAEVDAADELKTVKSAAFSSSSYWKVSLGSWNTKPTR
jgi:hypothetical protein